MKMNFEKSPILKKLFVNYGVPMNRTLGMKLKTCNDDATELFMKRKKKNTNYGGTIHGSAIMALAETAHGVSVLNRIGAFSNLMVSKNIELDFVKKATGDLMVRFELDKNKGDWIDLQLKENGKCEVELESIVTDKTGDIVAKLTANYHIKRSKKNNR